jgi:hypothetical protein
MYPIIINWMTVRSLTTVFMRAISERGDFQTVFEPFLPLYWNARKEQEGNGHVKNYDGWPTDYEGIRSKIFKMAEQGPVFVKEAALHAIDRLLEDEELLRRCKHMFQIRNPRRALLSSWKVRGTQKRNLEDLGTFDQGRMFKRITELNLHFMDNGATPLVIDGEDFEDNPEGIMKAWCKAVGVPYKPESLRWKPEWRNEYSHWDVCYYDVAKSSGIQKHMESFLYDERLVDTIYNDLPLLQIVYEYHKPAYDMMHAHRIHPEC